MAKGRGKLKGQFKKIANSIAKLYKLEIIKQDLIDTGLMRDTIGVQITIGKNGELDIQVVSTNYFIYVSGNFKIAENVFKSKAYKKLEDRMIELISIAYVVKFPDSFDSSDSVSYFFTYPSFEKGTEKFYKGGQFMPGGKQAPKGGIIGGRQTVVSKHF